MRYRLVVADLDGTVRSRTHGITDAAREAVAEARARGVRVCVATGRMWPSAEPWVRRLGADSPVILYNGGQIFDFHARRILYDRRLPRDSAHRALALIRDDPEVQPHVYLDDRVYVDRPHALTDAFTADDGPPCHLVPALDGLLRDDPHKILVIGAPERIEALGHAVRREGLPVHAVQSEPAYLEILPPGISKGAALRELLDALSVSAEEVVAVGDNWNDLEMIEAAGLGVAMGHAPLGVRARANHVCATADEDGFRQVLDRFVLGRAPEERDRGDHGHAGTTGHPA